MHELNELDLMVDLIGMLVDEHGIKCEDGHWMTEDELLALPENEIVALFHQIYGRD